jgi:fatty acid desaturase
VLQFGSFLERADYAEFRAGAGRAVSLTLLLWGFIIALMAANAAIWRMGEIWQMIGAGPLIFVAVGWAQFSLFNGAHEALHNNFGEPHKERLAAFILLTIVFSEIPIRIQTMRTTPISPARAGGSSAWAFGEPAVCPL